MSRLIQYGARVRACPEDQKRPRSWETPEAQPNSPIETPDIRDELRSAMARLQEAEWEYKEEIQRGVIKGLVVERERELVARLTTKLLNAGDRGPRVLAREIRTNSV